jgi:hypothetical protein
VPAHTSASVGSTVRHRGSAGELWVTAGTPVDRTLSSSSAPSGPRSAPQSRTDPW